MIGTSCDTFSWRTIQMHWPLSNGQMNLNLSTIFNVSCLYKSFWRYRYICGLLVPVFFFISTHLTSEVGQKVLLQTSTPFIYKGNQQKKPREMLQYLVFTLNSYTECVVLDYNIQIQGCSLDIWIIWFYPGSLVISCGH